MVKSEDGGGKVYICDSVRGVPGGLHVTHDRMKERREAEAEAGRPDVLPWNGQSTRCRRNAFPLTAQRTCAADRVKRNGEAVGAHRSHKAQFPRFWLDTFGFLHGKAFSR